MTLTENARFPPLKRRLAYAQVFEAIEAEILSGRLNDGDPIPTEMELCAQFDVQRSTVREGIRLLEQSGLVRRANGKRLSVARPKTDEAAASTSRGLERHGVRFVDIWEAISTIQPETARLAAQKIKLTDIDRLEQITSQLMTAEDAADVVEFGVEYLQAIAIMTRNRVIAVVLSSLNSLAKSSLQQVIHDLPDARERMIEAQHQITKALKVSDGKIAAMWMARHVDDLRRGYEVAGVDLSSEIGATLRPD